MGAVNNRPFRVKFFSTCSYLKGWLEGVLAVCCKRGSRTPDKLINEAEDEEAATSKDMQDAGRKVAFGVLAEQCRAGPGLTCCPF